MQPSTRLWFLGTPHAEYADQPAHGFESRKAFALLGYLASHGTALPRAQLATLFWPDHTDERARSNLRSLLHNLTTVLPGCLAVDRQTVRISGDATCWLDTAAFEDLAAQNTLTSLAAAAELYRSAFLDGLYLDDCPEVETWLTQQREHWHERAAHVLTELTARAHERQEWVAGLRSVDRLLALDPWRETAHQDKMRLLALSGQRDSALAQYEICRRVLSEELGLDPAPETTALYEQIRDGLLTAPVAAPLSSSQIPIPATPLLGRADELAQISQLLAQPACRLLTLLGPGGVGKTRLALEIATQQQSRFGDGACVVELATIHDSTLVASTIAQTLGLPQSVDQSVSVRLKAWLRDKHLLLFLDNFEQILPAALLVGELLAASPRLTVLVTSRIPLHLRGEQEYAVGPLALPPRATDGRSWPVSAAKDSALGQAALDVLMQYAVIALFIQLAQHVKADFQLTAANARPVAEICTRLDGLPLAIELAAARIKLFQPHELLARLEHRLPFLTSRMRDRPPHQQTIRNTIEWSYQLLDAHEQALFARLAVFVGGWTLELAEAVVGADPALELDVVNGMAALVDHSLIRQQLDAHDEPRFFMLETIREYALEQLAASAFEAQTRRDHASVFLALAEQVRQLVIGPQLREAMEQLETEHDNLRAALSFIVQQGDADLAQRLAAALGPFWRTRGYLAEGYHWMTTVRAIASSAVTIPYLEVIHGQGLLVADQGNHELAATHYQELLELAYTQGDKRWIGIALIRSDSFEEALALFQELGDTRMIATTLLNKGRQLAFEQRDYAHATACFNESLALSEQISDQTGIIYAHLHLGLLAMLAGSLQPALEHAQTALRLAWFVKNEVMIATAFDELAATAGLSGMLQQSARLFGVAEALRAPLGAPRGEDEQALYERYLALVRGQLDAASFEAMWTAGQALPPETAVAEALGMTLSLGRRTP